ncbi:MAG: citrate synthase [Vicinamibacterales bacterium]
MPETLTITDNRTGKQYEAKVEDGAIRAMDLRKIKTSGEDFGLVSYDPAYLNTASCRSAITYIDGDRGVLEYRGYPIEQLAEHSTYTETAYLLVNGELPTSAQLAEWAKSIQAHVNPPAAVKGIVSAFARNAHPMTILMSTMGALSASSPDARRIFEAPVRREHMMRIIAQAPTVAAFAFRHGAGKSFVDPDPSLSLTANFLRMLFHGDGGHGANPVLERALDVLFILHADHEQNCSTSAMRAIGSSHVDPYSAFAGAAAALYGPLHGGANEAVLHMLQHIGSIDHIPEFIKGVKGGSGRLMGFGHRVYKSYDPRARIIKRTAEEVFEVTGKNPLLDIALELERIALEDDYFVSRKLYPNVDFYSGLIYQALGFPMEFFTVLFAVPRTSGWIAQWEEMLLDPEQKITRPRQLYVGPAKRDYLPADARKG